MTTRDRRKWDVQLTSSPHLKMPVFAHDAQVSEGCLVFFDQEGVSVGGYAPGTWMSFSEVRSQ